MTQDARRIIFLVSGGTRTGLGHVRRCLTLAEALRERRVAAAFVVVGDQAVGRVIRQAGGAVLGVVPRLAAARRLLAEDRAPRVIVDVKPARAREMASIREAAAWVGAIDDLGHAGRWADLITNSAAYAPLLRYGVRRGVRRLLGPRYALLRDAFARPAQRTARPGLRRILITLGGSDPRQLTPRLIRWTRAICPHARIDVVVGPFFTRLSAVRDAQASRVLVNPRDLAAWMRRADVAVIGGGQTTYEAAACGTPALGIETAAEQHRNLEAMARAGSLCIVGRASSRQLGRRYQSLLRRLQADPARRGTMSRAGRRLIDGQGARRVALAVVRSNGW